MPKLFILIVQVERRVRDMVNVKRLNSDSPVNLKSTLLDYNFLKLSWEKFFLVMNLYLSNGLIID